jgi:hypothetical protein
MTRAEGQSDGRFGQQKVEGEVIREEPAELLLRLEGLDLDQTQDLEWQIRNKLGPGASVHREVYESIADSLRAGAENSEPIAFEFRLDLQTSADLIPRIRSLLTAQTRQKYRELYLEISRALVRARRRFFRA